VLSLLCETVTGRTMAELLAARDAAGSADLVELRLDGVRDLDVERAVHGRPRPVVATCRPTWEGGKFDGAEEERNAVLARALAAGAEYVDVEWRAGFTGIIDADRSRVVLSSHDFDRVPTDLLARARLMRATGAAVIKIAVMPSRLTDGLALREVAQEGNAVVIGMGAMGVPTRLLATRFGSRWTYAGDAVAPGQMPAARMLDEFRFRSITDATAVYGVAGLGALDSPIPGARNAAFAASGVDAVCIPLPAENTGDIEAFARALGFNGWERCT
jgi:3-dehydroquinate dehydratase type I